MYLEKDREAEGVKELAHALRNTGTCDLCRARSSWGPRKSCRCSWNLEASGADSRPPQGPQSPLRIFSGLGAAHHIMEGDLDPSIPSDVNAHLVSNMPPWQHRGQCLTRHRSTAAQPSWLDQSAPRGAVVPAGSETAMPHLGNCFGRRGLSLAWASFREDVDVSQSSAHMLHPF